MFPQATIPARIINGPAFWINCYNYTGDAAAVAGYLENAQGKLEHAYRTYGTNPSLVFYGWDERLGGFEPPSCPESQRAHKIL